MSRLTAGWFSSNFWPENYYHDYYWPNASPLFAPSAYVFYYSSSDILRTMNFTADILTTATSNQSILMTITSKVILGE